MPVFFIQYTKSQTNHETSYELEWITEADWDPTRTRQHFHKQFPDASITRFFEVEGFEYSEPKNLCSTRDMGSTLWESSVQQVEAG